MIRDVLLPLLTERFPGRFITAEPAVEPCVIFPAKHPEIGDVQIYDDGDEITSVAGRFTHGHLSNYDDIPVDQKEKQIAASVADFLHELFSGQVVLWGSHERVGGRRAITNSDRSKKGKVYVWSGPRNGQ